jgi:uncharacterized membrane protein
MNPNIARKRHAKSFQSRTAHSSSNGQSEHQQINVGDFERQVSMWGGTVLAAYGLLRGSMSGLALAAIGGALIWRGHTGHCEMYHMLGHNTANESSQVRESNTNRSQSHENVTA